MSVPALVMSPLPGDRVQLFVGDRVRVVLSRRDAAPFPRGWRGRLRTNLGRAMAARDEVIAHRGSLRPFAGASWRDLELDRDGDSFAIDLPLTEIGWFRAKAYAIDEHGQQHWPDGADLGIAVQPDASRTANTIYCAFVRQFGASAALSTTRDPLRDEVLATLDQHGYAVIPPSGRLRDLSARLDHIVNRLSCRILHLLPVTPTPTTHARFGRYGSPYAVQDLTAIDPALVEFDQRTTGIDQFRELTYAAHHRGCRVFLDVVLNHTGWGSTLQERHPEWYRREPDGRFHSPGAWGNTWEDLVELDHHHPDLWDVHADALLEWCRRGVDGFRCDAGYMVPCEAWQYITARVRREFPDTVFLLEGLGGAWSATEKLLTEGGLQWAYSELFQNYDGPQVSAYVDHLIKHAGRLGNLINYSETHDNARLAARGRTWALLRHRLCALTSMSGGFGFTAGCEWLATEQVNVHQSRGLNWGAADHLVGDLARLNRLLLDHPCFFDGAQLTRLSADGAGVLVLARRSADGRDYVLVLANLDPEQPAAASWTSEADQRIGKPRHELLADAPRHVSKDAHGVMLQLAPGEVLCLAPARVPVGLAGDEYRRQRALAGAAYRILSRVLAPEDIGSIEWRALATLIDRDPVAFVAGVARLDRQESRRDLVAALARALARDDLPQVVTWHPGDRQRILPVPPGHWLVVRGDGPFTARLGYADRRPAHRVEAIRASSGWFAGFPAHEPGDAELLLDSFAQAGVPQVGHIRFLAAIPRGTARLDEQGLILCTNGRGAMQRVAVDLGRITSKYDCLLAANLHPLVPVDRHVLVKRLRAWVVADGFSTSLDRDNLANCEAGPPAQWRFIANAGDSRTAEIHLETDLLDGRNVARITLSRPTSPPLWGDDLPAAAEVAVVLRLDLEDRTFHAETVRTDHLDAHFCACTQPLDDGIGFRFSPAPDRIIEARCEAGTYHHASEWACGLPHTIEASRGMSPSGDAWSPGWFRVVLKRGARVTLLVGIASELPATLPPCPRAAQAAAAITTAGATDDPLLAMLARAAQPFLVQRGTGTTVIAGYPWFLDWGRDTLITARGLISLGQHETVLQILATFGRFEAGGTLPNMIHGEDASNRDTSDASLWYGVVCEELAEVIGERAVYGHDVGGRSIRDVLGAIANGYWRGTENGIHADQSSGLIWSPSHFTWMDTNHPAGTPREGYPVSIQALWIRLLRQLDVLGDAGPGPSWGVIAERATTAFERLYWLPDAGWLADVLMAPRGVSAVDAVADHALRSNAVLPVALGICTGAKARSVVEATRRHLIVPGALRSLAPLTAHPPAPIRANDGRLLNDPHHPYWGRYAGDEDTRRKPAYHNGTAWVWTFPTFCEALAMAWNWSPTAVAAARAYLGSIDDLLHQGCLGQLPEICDGDAPHTQRGCDAQAWSVSESARVWKLLRRQPVA